MKKPGTTTSVVVLFFLLSLIFAALLSSDRLHSQATARPNIVFIVADDMGHADVGAYGGRIQTVVALDTRARARIYSPRAKKFAQRNAD